MAFECNRESSPNPGLRETNRIPDDYYRFSHSVLVVVFGDRSLAWKKIAEGFYLGRAFRSSKQSNFEVDGKCNTQVNRENGYMIGDCIIICSYLGGFFFLQKYQPAIGPWQARRFSYYTYTAHHSASNHIRWIPNQTPPAPQSSP